MTLPPTPPPLELFRKFIRDGTYDPEYPALINIKDNGKGSCLGIHKTRSTTTAFVYGSLFLIGVN